ncbi:ParB/RepB/Spo0J family partition protein [Ruegeria sp. HKCCD8929]|uniref:ParB/RepB/Spo0J family partition protein n=1 Tax=Ruegeria sp. HKCCD8929 TaxID=2683006 RepID=UPI001487CBB8|nr:ParB/RepB/Spo0J family partition protein [Ruegeria sp. HKCCD8929]
MANSTYTETFVPLNKLVIHPDNVRAKSEEAHDEGNIRPLAANIAVRGLLQPLIVRRLEDGKYGVVDGGRRRAALTLLAGDKTAKGFTRAMKVPCREMSAEEGAVVSVSFSGNLQLPMSALERYEAFAAMQDKDGADVATIARAFAITDRQVKEALRLGNIHPEIRAAYRAGKLNLEALKAFDGHPDPEVQLATFKGQMEEFGHIQEWRVRSAFRTRFVRVGHALGQFIKEEYIAAGGDIVADLIEEDSILSDGALIDELLAQKLDDLAEQKRAELGFAWAEAHTSIDWGELSDYGRVYPQPVDLDEEDQARAEALIEKMDKIEEESHEATSAEDLDRLDDEHEALNQEYEALTNAYSEGDKAIAGVIAIWDTSHVDYRIGFVRPEHMPDQEDEPAGQGARTEDPADAAPEDTGPKISAKLRDDMAHVRTRAIGVALAQSPALARDYADFTLITSVLKSGYVRTASTISASRANYGPLEPEGSLKQIEDVYGALQEGLELDWLELDGAGAFNAFRGLSDDARRALLAFAVAHTLEPRTAPGLNNPVREVVEREALPNIRDVWTPDESFLKRLIKPDLLKVLRDVGLRNEAKVYEDGKKSKLVEYMTKLFAEPFATLTDEQRTSVTSWAPELMALPAQDNDHIAPDAEGDPGDDEMAVAAE